MAEEEEQPTPININMETPPDPSSIDRKHAAMLSRLHQSRTTTAAATSSDSTASFLSQFSATKTSIQLSLSQLPLSQNPNPKPALQTLSQQISSLQNDVAQHSYLLPSYELRSSLKSIQDLKHSLDTLTSQLIPRQKFSFKSKKANNNYNNNATPPPKPIDDLKHNHCNDDDEVVSLLFNNPVRDSPDFKRSQNEVLVKEFRDGDGEGEFMLSEFTNCQVRLSGCLRALFVHKLRDCRVYVGAVYGSVLIEEVEGCVFVMASHQIRIHCAKGTDFYLRVRSRPIIEDCSGVRFAPYCLRYEGIEGDLEKANLDEEMGNWANVDDFRWLRAVQSPNWSVLPECERIGSVIISNSEA